MKYVLASMGFINEDVQHNKNVIIDTLVRCSKEAEIVIFGESFLQGFYGATFDAEHDTKLRSSIRKRSGSLRGDLTR